MCELSLPINAEGGDGDLHGDELGRIRREELRSDRAHAPGVLACNWRRRREGHP